MICGLVEDKLMKRCNNIQKLSDNPFLNLFHIDAMTRNGKKFDYYFASRNNEESLEAVTGINKTNGIAIYTVRKENPNQLVMIKQFRYPINDYMYEIPAGLIDEGENASQSAIREMKEETGLDMEVYTGGADYFRRPMYLAQGLTDESTIMVYGTVEGSPNRDNLEDSEDIEVIFVDKTEARRILAEEKVSARASFMLMMFINSDADKPFDFLNK